MQFTKKSRHVLALAVAALMAAPAFAATEKAKAADKPKTTAKTEAPAEKAAGGEAVYGVKIGGFFNDQQKQAARRVFSQKYAKAKDCPAGLAPKGNTCASPWDQRYWAVGQSLQPAVQVYPLPQPVAAQLPNPPKGYEYVRAADDILLISSGSKLVVDMIEHVGG
jgi:Ni/Co efflux regulator RcnB